MAGIIDRPSSSTPGTTIKVNPWCEVYWRVSHGHEVLMKLLHSTTALVLTQYVGHPTQVQLFVGWLKRRAMASAATSLAETIKTYRWVCLCLAMKRDAADQFSSFKSNVHGLVCWHRVINLQVTNPSCGKFTRDTYAWTIDIQEQVSTIYRILRQTPTPIGKTKTVIIKAKTSNYASALHSSTAQAQLPIARRVNL